MNTHRFATFTLFAFLSSVAFAQSPTFGANQNAGADLGYTKKHTMKIVRVDPGTEADKTVGALTAKQLAPPTYALCEARFQIPCYSPQQIRKAYGLSQLINSGYDGKGQTIVVIDSFGSPTIAADLKKFDQDFGLPDPPSFQVLSPLGTVPFDVTNDDMVGWAEETSLDVEWAHAIAPSASIILMTSPVSETEGVQGLPEFLALEQYAVSHNLGKIVTQSWSATENTLFTTEGRTVLNAFNSFYEASTLFHGVTFLASSGDSGSANPDISGNIYPFPTVGFPASSPWVTAVGGTSLYADANGNYQSETVWSNAYGATGGGVSQYFAEPLYQQISLPISAQTVLNRHRGLPDIAYDADPSTPVPVYLGFLGSRNSGYYLFGGTSSSSPQWAGVVAIANQSAGVPVGFLNPSLYLLGAAKLDYYFLRDVTLGNNSFDGIPGYQATPGWDAATGWGTPDLGKLISDLATLKQTTPVP